LALDAIRENIGYDENEIDVQTRIANKDREIAEHGEKFDPDNEKWKVYGESGEKQWAVWKYRLNRDRDDLIRERNSTSTQTTCDSGKMIMVVLLIISILMIIVLL
jgi:hypothetical protein